MSVVLVLATLVAGQTNVAGFTIAPRLKPTPTFGSVGRGRGSLFSTVLSEERVVSTQNVTDTIDSFPLRPPMKPMFDPTTDFEAVKSHHKNPQVIIAINPKSQDVNSTLSHSKTSIGEDSSIIMERLKNLEDLDGIAGNLGNLVQQVFGKTVKQRLWTKADFMHIHAVSGAIYLGAGIPWTLYTTFKHFGANGVDLALSENLSSFFLMFLALQGSINALSAIPMARFSSNKIFDLSDLKGLGFSVGGTGLTLMCLWAQVWFSGDGYPSWLHGVPDMTFFAFWTFICVATTYNWETMLQMNVETQNGKGLSRSEAKKAGNKKFASNASKTGEEGFGVEKQILYRLASWPNLTQLLFLASPCFGGVAWMNQVAETYPLQQTLCFHYAFASALGYSISMFSETLRDRKIVTLRQDMIILILGTVYPMLMVVADSIAFGDKVTINPMDYWYIFQ